MAAFSPYHNHTYMPFPVDPLVFPSPNSINNSFKLSADDHLPQPNAAGNLNSLFGPSDLPGNAVFVKGIDGISRQISTDTSAAYKKQSTTTTESSSAAALDDDKVGGGGGGDQLSAGTISATATVNNRRRKTRNSSTLSSGQSKDEGEGGKAKRQKNKKEKKGSNEVKEEKKGREEPPKDYIHVRARRGQATDSHSLAERVRREKISERMKTLQNLVPGCDKVTGKALMLDEIINYVQSLQNQVEFLSMKLASLSPVFYDFGVDLDTFIVRPEGMVGMATSNTPHGQHMGQRQTTTAFTDATIAAAIATTTTAPLSSSPHFSTLFDHSSPSPLLLPQNSLLLPLSQDNINGSVLKNVEEHRHNRFLNTTGLFNSLCSFN